MRGKSVIPESRVERLLPSFYVSVSMLKEKVQWTKTRLMRIRSHGEPGVLRTRGGSQDFEDKKPGWSCSFVDLELARLGQIVLVRFGPR